MLNILPKKVFQAAQYFTLKVVQSLSTYIFAVKIWLKHQIKCRKVYKNPNTNMCTIVKEKLVVFEEEVPFDYFFIASNVNR